MGDRRFDSAYEAVATAGDRARAIRALDDEEVIHALAAASRKMDGYLANVLAVEVLNRRRRQRAIQAGVIAALALVVLTRSIVLLIASPGRTTVVASLAVVVPAVLGGWLAYRWMLHRGAH